MHGATPYKLVILMEPLWKGTLSCSQPALHSPSLFISSICVGAHTTDIICYSGLFQPGCQLRGICVCLSGAACLPGQQGNLSAGNAVGCEGPGPAGGEPCVQPGSARGQRPISASRGARRAHRQPGQGWESSPAHVAHSQKDDCTMPVALYLGCLAHGET